ncbi:fused MFS/spermidine synthase [Luteimonas kalidii]|uniref:Fused MFS/spermidine synthase n=1 Tax=Luteimonas kalidii TaxID=3042025 RepID=A0ABT6JP80_9GAMM|nr:fused MFS/spermidine synthase [Luteimonas kalidii]MDH5832495.1 fused MFS/spermidine synthase [Luteimonas kalidii]
MRTGSDVPCVGETAGGGADATSASAKPVILRGWRHTDLQFAGGVSQSRMRTFRPGHLAVDYTRTMMASLLWCPRPALIGMVGLGGGSQVKFCHRYLRQTRLEVAENNPHVIALRRTFRVPRDDARLQVLLADGARFVQERRGRFDILLVDGYDASGIPAELSSQRFYDDCRDALAPGGVFASNLYATDFADHLSKLRRSFGAEHVWMLEEARQSNRVAFAWVGDPFPDGRIDLPAIARVLPPRLAKDLAGEFQRVAAAWRAR